MTSSTISTSRSAISVSRSFRSLIGLPFVRPPPSYGASSRKSRWWRIGSERDRSVRKTMLAFSAATSSGSRCP
jgi:hypothetical protein